MNPNSRNQIEAFLWFVRTRGLSAPSSSNTLVIFPPADPALVPWLLQENSGCYTPFRDTVFFFENQKIRVEPEPAGPYDRIIAFGTRNKEECFYHVALAARLLRRDGVLLYVMANALGGAAFIKKCCEALGPGDSESKSKCRLYRWINKDAPLNRERLEVWCKNGIPRPVAGTPLFAIPGTFSSRAMDKGSELLSRHLPQDLSGIGADLGSGYGALGFSVLSRPNTVSALHLFENDLRALNVSKSNLTGVSGSVNITWHWQDVSTGLPVGEFDWVMMNPPFHDNKGESTALGVRFITIAAEGLKKSGWLFMVANQSLPYENTLKTLYSEFKTITEQAGYKIIVARK
jgi:16S rRNA (guanine1207-N2)-methyltransferase